MIRACSDKLISGPGLRKREPPWDAPGKHHSRQRRGTSSADQLKMALPPLVHRFVLSHLPAGGASGLCGGWLRGRCGLNDLLPPQRRESAEGIALEQP